MGFRPSEQVPNLSLPAHCTCRGVAPRLRGETDPVDLVHGTLRADEVTFPPSASDSTLNRPRTTLFPALVTSINPFSRSNSDLDSLFSGARQNDVSTFASRLTAAERRRGQRSPSDLLCYMLPASSRQSQQLLRNENIIIYGRRPCPLFLTKPPGNRSSDIPLPFFLFHLHPP